MTTPGGGEPRTIDVPISGPAPSQTYSLPPGVTFDVEAVYVEVDTSGAAGAVTAELSIAEQSGVVIAKKKQAATIPAGSSGTATWALRLDEGAAASTAGAGLQYVTNPQTGAWFYADATGSGGPEGWAWEFKDVNGNGTAFSGIPILFGDYNHVNNGTSLILNSTGQHIVLTGNQRFDIATGVGTVFRADNTFAGNRVGFFGVTPVVQQPTPVTLGDVIALLQAYGLAV